MGPFFDMHSHMLCKVDDGAKDRDMMFAMLEAAYANGTRALCLTPHYSPYLYGDTSAASAAAFALLQRYTADHHPDMRLFLGHELGYHGSCLAALESGACRSIAGSRYVLVDFPAEVDFFELQNAMGRLRSAGIHTILAHAERYRCLFRHMDWIRNYVDDGGLTQLNASSVAGAWGTVAKMQWKRILKADLAHIISTDAHNLTTRPPDMTVCMPYLQRHCNSGQICDLTWNNAWRVVQNKSF